MSDLLRRIELTKLGAELGVGPDAVAFLGDLDEAVLADLRGLVGTALFAPNEPRFKRLAALSKVAPASLVAKIAQLALGPQLAARVAAVMEPSMAVQLATKLSPEFLTELATSLDPAKVQPIVSRLPQDLIVDVGTRLLRRKEYLTLGRFTSIVDADTALRVVAEATPHALLQTALFTEDRTALDRIVAILADERLVEVIEASRAEGSVDDSLILLAVLPDEARRRIVRIVGAHDPALIEELRSAAGRHDLRDDLLT